MRNEDERPPERKIRLTVHGMSSNVGFLPIDISIGDIPEPELDLDPDPEFDEREEADRAGEWQFPREGEEALGSVSW